MICFNCGLKLNTDDIKECRLCGVKLALKCQSCEAFNPVLAKYCLNCGTKLAKDHVESSVQNFNTLAESRKNVAVIFADVSGFTALSEKMDPEEVRDLINDCFNYITKPVYELEGTIDKYIGDCVMILFGARYEHSDDARRAVNCAMKMLERIKEYSEERLSSRGFTLNLSIGINYGLVVTGSIGNYFDKDYTVMGDIVNTAQRLQVSAEKGVILVSESVYMETKEAIHYSKASEVIAKNKETPIKCYIPVAMMTEYSFDRNMAFVERESEIGRLISLYNLALSTGTQCVVLVGEAGIGKTRLLREFSAKLGPDAKKVWVDCSSSYQSRVYFTVANLLMSIMNINPEDSNTIKKHRLMSFLDYILNHYSDEEREKNSNFLGLVLGLSRDHEFQNILNSMGFENIGKEVIKQLSIFFIGLSEKYRLVLLIDSIHWADVNSIEVFRELIPLIRHSNILFVFSSRYEIDEFIPEGGRLYHLLRLQALSEAAVNYVMSSLLGGNRVDQLLLETAVKYTQGNPLYLREFTANIRKEGRYEIIDGQVQLEAEAISFIPNNTQSIILASLTELEDAAKGFLQAASVVGKDFSLSLVTGILDYHIDEVHVLKLPVQLNIIALKSVYTASGSVEKIYTFNHDVEREAIYESVLNKRKKELHKKIAEWIEVKYNKDIESYYEILAEHYQKAGMDKKACEFLYKTAVKYKNTFSFNNALEYFNRFYNLVCSKESLLKDPNVASALTDIGYIHFVMASYDQAAEYLNKALQLVNLSDDIYSIKILLADIYKEQGMYDQALAVIEEIQPKIKQGNRIYGKLLQMKCSILRIIGNPEALSLAKKSEKILLKSKDYESLSETMNQAGIIYYFTKGDVDHSLFYLNKSYRYAEKTNNLEILGKVAGNLGAIYHATGMVSKAQEYFTKSIDISKKIYDQQGYISGCINLGVLFLDKGFFDKAETLMKESLQISVEISSRLYECISLTNLGDMMYERSCYSKALEYYNRSADVAKSINVPVEEGVNYLGIARLCIEEGRLEEAANWLDKSYSILNDSGEAMCLSDYHRYRSICELQQSRIDVAQESCERALALSVECKSDIRKLKALRLKGNLMTVMEEYEKAVQLYSDSILLAQQIESDYETAKGFYRRARANALLGNTEASESDLQKAREAIGRVDHSRWTEKVEGRDE